MYFVEKNNLKNRIKISSSETAILFIEVLGSADANYLDHKDYIAEYAKQHCDYYLSIKAFNLQKERDAFVKRLNGILSSVDLVEYI